MKHIVIANWKMHGTRSNWVSWANATMSTVNELQGTHVALCTPSAAFQSVSAHLQENGRVHLGAQSIHEHEQGAFTGETSVEMLKDFGGEYALVGHSEYREMYKNKPDMYGAQMRYCLRAKVKPVLCIGESSAERQAGKTVTVLDEQLEEGLKDVHFLNPQDLLIAYEPVWGIGGAKALKTPEVSDVKEAFRFIRSSLVERFGDIGLDIPLLYGGSIDAGNVSSFMQELGIFGVLVGSASLKSDTFADILRQVDQL